MGAEKQVTRQAFEDGKGFRVIVGDAGIIFVAHQNVARIHVGAADDHGVEPAGALLNLHGPCGAPFGVPRGEPGDQPRATQFDRVPVVEDPVDGAPGRPGAVLSSSATSASITIRRAPVSLRMIAVAAS